MWLCLTIGNGSSDNSPAIHIALVHKPCEFPLGEHGIVEIEAGILPDVRLTQPQGFNHPVELLISIMVLSGTKSMGHALYAVYDGAGKVICGVNPGEKEK